MALEQIPGGLWTPYPPAFGQIAPAYTMFLLDASAEKGAFVFPAPKTGTIDQVEFRLGTVAQAPANGLKCSLQTVDPANGNPDGTVDQYRVVSSGLSSNAWIAPGLMTSDGTDGGTKRSVTRGEVLAFVVEFSSFLAGDSAEIALLDVLARAAMGDMPYAAVFIASWSKGQTQMPVMAVKYDDGSYPFVLGGVVPAASLITTAYNSGSVPDEVGMTFSFPSDVLIGGGYVRVDLDGDADFIIYDNAGLALATTSMDKDVRAQTSMRWHSRWFASDVRIYANETYRLAMKPTSVTSITIAEFTVSAAAMLGALEGGTSWQRTSRTDGGDWTDVATQKPWMGLVVTAIDHEIGGSPQEGFAGVA